MARPFIGQTPSKGWSYNLPIGGSFMRISTLLLFLFLSGLLLAGVAPARGQATADSLPAESSHATWAIPQTKLDFANGNDLAIDQYQLPKAWNESLERLALDKVGPARDQICYTMRSYKVERAERFQDSTGRMQYSTCQPSSRFDVKNADERVTIP
jgi:hypothetical protein